MSTLTAVGVLIALLALNAYFVAAEFAMVSARRDQIEPAAVDGSTGARYALRGIEDVSTSLAATQLGITACSLLIGAVGEPAIAHFLEDYIVKIGLPASASHLVALIIALLFVTFLHMVLGEMVPKNIAITSPTRTARFVGPSLHFFVRNMRPVIWLMNETANRLVRLLFKATPKDEVDSAFTSSQVQDFVAESGRQGLLDNDELALLQKALSFENLTAGDITIAKDDLTTVTRDVTPAQIEQMCADTRYSRFPVVDRKGRIRGYVHAKDMLQLDEDARHQPLPSSLIRTLTVVQADDKLQKVMRIMQRAQVHFAIVASSSPASGGVSIADATKSSAILAGDDGAQADQAFLGIIALEDVLEELVGEVRQATS